MGRFLTSPRIAAATLILLIGSSASQAWFGRGYYYYYYTAPACSQATPAAASPTVAPATKPAVAPAAKPAVTPAPAQGSHTTYMPVTPANTAADCPSDVWSILPSAVSVSRQLGHEQREPTCREVRGTSEDGRPTNFAGRAGSRHPCVGTTGNDVLSPLGWHSDCHPSLFQEKRHCCLFFSVWTDGNICLPGINEAGYRDAAT